MFSDVDYLYKSETMSFMFNTSITIIIIIITTSSILLSPALQVIFSSTLPLTFETRG